MDASGLMEELESELMYLKLMGYEVSSGSSLNDIDVYRGGRDGFCINCFDFIEGEGRYFTLEDLNYYNDKIIAFNIEEFKKKLIEFFDLL